MTEDPQQRWFLECWQQREDNVYPSLFGDIGQGVHTATAEHFARLKQKAQHPGWLHHGVFACPPSGDRQHWCYVTSGLSNPWNLDKPEPDPSGFSGCGFELSLCTPAASDWAIAVLHHLMAWQLLVAVGTVQGQPLGVGQRVPLGGAIDGSRDGAMTWVVVEKPDQFEPSFELPSGKVDWLQLCGVTDSEVEFARKNSQGDLLKRLRTQAIWPVSDPARQATS